MKTDAERKRTERARRRKEGLRPFEIWVNPRDWPFIKELVDRFNNSRKKNPL